jgi:hypothetical protein
MRSSLRARGTQSKSGMVSHRNGASASADLRFETRDACLKFVEAVVNAVARIPGIKAKLDLERGLSLT